MIISAQAWWTRACGETTLSGTQVGEGREEERRGWRGKENKECEGEGLSCGGAIRRGGGTYVGGLSVREGGAGKGSGGTGGGGD